MRRLKDYLAWPAYWIAAFFLDPLADLRHAWHMSMVARLTDTERRRVARAMLIWLATFTVLGVCLGWRLADAFGVA